MHAADPEKMLTLSSLRHLAGYRPGGARTGKGDQDGHHTPMIHPFVDRNVSLDT